MDQVRVGIGTFLFNPRGEFLLGLRRGSHGAATWGLTGGHLEFGESFAMCAAREAKEETGIALRDVQYFATTNDIFFQDSRHYVTVFMAEMRVIDEVPRRMEPEKLVEWRWFAPDNLPENLFLPIKNLLKDVGDNGLRNLARRAIIAGGAQQRAVA